MPTKEKINQLRERIKPLWEDADAYFKECTREGVVLTTERHHWADRFSSQLRAWELRLRQEVKQLCVDVAGTARVSVLIAEADLHELRRNMRRMLASLRFREYQYGGVYVHHDEDVVLGTDPPWQTEVPHGDVTRAEKDFGGAINDTAELIDLIIPGDVTSSGDRSVLPRRPNTAFIIMAINDKRPELEDVKWTIQSVCKEFGIVARRSDEFEHSDSVPMRVIQEIETSEFVIADLSDDRPNVYYEVGYADAVDARIMFFRREGATLHFDIAHRHCPAYASFADLGDRLRKRLAEWTGKPAKS